MHPRIVEQSDPASTDLTKIVFRPVTPELIDAMGENEYKTQFLAQIMESRAVGVMPNTLAELLMSRIEPLGKGEKLQEYSTGTTFISAPFKYRQRTRNTRVGMFNISAGGVNAHAGTTFGGVVYPASAWDINVNVGPSPWATAFTDLARFFLTGHFIYVEHYNASTKVAYTSAHKVVAASNADTNNATVTVSAVGYTDAQWAGLTSGQKLPYQPTFGGLSLGANNVSDYESFGHNPPTDLGKELLVDWCGTIRTYREQNKEYLDALAAILDGKVNELQTFRNMAMTKRNQQMMAFEELQLLNTIWFGQREVGQTADPVISDILNLPVALDPEDGTPLERKANILGIQTQLVENNRRIDLQGAPFDLDLLFDESHNLRRNRRLDGKSWDNIVWMTDRWTKDNWDQALIRYLQDVYGLTTTRFVNPGKIFVEGTKIIAFEYTTYEIPRQHLSISIMTHEFFEDKILAFPDANKSRGRMAVSIDFDDIRIWVAAMNSAKREYKGQTTANANSLWSKVIKMNTKEIELRSKTMGVEFGDFNRHTIFENFSNACPTLTVSVCSPTLS
jgi:hypothetical protein